MPRIVCLSCGREVYSTVPAEQLFDDERRCPRCGAPLENDRRVADRRVGHLHAEEPDKPVPPAGHERPATERRGEQRRRGDAAAGRRDDGWLE